MALQVLPPPDSPQSTQLFFSWMSLSKYSAYTLGLFPPQGLCTCHSTAWNIPPPRCSLMTGSFNPTGLRLNLYFFPQKGLSFLTTLSKRSSLETLLYPISLPQSPLLLLLLLFIHSVMPDSLRPHGLQHTRFPFPPLSSRVRSRSCPLSQWCHPTISSSVVPFTSRLQSSPALGSFFNESALRIKWPKYWSSTFSISPSSEYSGLISFWIDWFDLLAVQGTLKSLLQHHRSVPLRRFKFILLMVANWTV